MKKIAIVGAITAFCVGVVSLLLKRKRKASAESE